MMDNEVHKTGLVLQSGGIILYPTDTIWGIGCNAEREESVQKIYRIKQRADFKSMLVLVDGLPMLEKYITKIPERALEILKSSSKPTTIIYPEARNLPENLLAPDGSIGIRITSDPFCRKLIRFTGFPIVSTSANISGEPPPGNYHQIKSSIRERVDHVVNWRRDEATPSKPSSIIKLEEDGRITVIRS